MDVFITEVGISVPNESKMTQQQIINDSYRQSYFQRILEQVSLSYTIDHIPIKMFLVWSLLDNFEWGNYNERFGIVAVDFNNGTLKRTLKDSGRALSEFFKDSKSPLGFSKGTTHDNAKDAIVDSDGVGKNDAVKSLPSVLVCVIGSSLSLIN